MILNPYFKLTRLAAAVCIFDKLTMVYSIKVILVVKGKALMIVFLMIAAFTAVFTAWNIPTVRSAYLNVAKPMEFYFHYSDLPVNVAGLETKFIFNTTRAFARIYC